MERASSAGFHRALVAGKLPHAPTAELSGAVVRRQAGSRHRFREWRSRRMRFVENDREPPVSRCRTIPDQTVPAAHEPYLFADVVVAGAGGAGLTAALAAAERGLSVVLVEARETFREDSNTAMSTSMVPAAGTRQQAAAGIDDDPQLFLSDVMCKTHDAADRVVATALVNVAAQLVHWLEDRWRIPLGLVTDFNYAGHSRHRCHSVPDRAGSTLHGHLLAAIGRLDNVLLACPARLVGVRGDAADGVTGAIVERPSGEREEVGARSVILATNGFGASPDLVGQHCPEIAGGLYFGGEGSTGDALALGELFEADLAYLDAYQGHGSVAHPHGVLLTWAAVIHGGVLVNRTGKRFADESPGYSELARPVLEQPGGKAWMVYDERIDELCRPFADYQRCLEAGAVLAADGIEQLAHLIGAPTAVLAATLERSAAAARAGTADEFGRSDWAAPLAPPYRVVRVTGALFHTQGGLCVDGRARVLSQGVPIPGLFAAGGSAAGISGHGAAGYLAGNGLLSALGLGLLAGRSALSTD